MNITASLLITLMLLTIVTEAEAQNFNFELSGAKNVPRYWVLKNKGFETSLSSEFVYDGHRSFRAISMDSASSMAIYTTLNGNLIAPGEITVEAFVKYEKAQGIPDVFCRLDGEGELLGYVSSKNIKVSGDKTWHRISCSLSTKAPFKKLVAGFTFRGKGIVFVDNFSVSIDGQKLPDAAIGQKDAECINLSPEILRSRIKYSGIEDTKYLSSIQSKRLIAIGEAVHGSSEIYRAKTQLTKALIQQNNVASIYIELDHVDALHINEYLQNKDAGDLKAILSGLSNQFLNSQVLFEFIVWLREYNVQHKKNISFVGIDFQDASRNSTRLSQLFGDKNRDQIDTLLASLRTNSDTITGDRQVVCNALKLLSELTRTIGNVNERRESIYICRLLAQKLAFVNSGNRLAELISRDSSMAVNVLGEMTNDTTRKSVIWAHNMHISKMEPYMGSHLAKSLKDKYHTIGMSFDGGKFTTLGIQDQSFHVTEAFDAGPGSIEFCLAALQYNTLISTEHLVDQYDIRLTGAQDTGRQFLYSIKLSNLFDFFYLCERSTPLIHPQ